jgi:hypothetical protein
MTNLENEIERRGPMTEAQKTEAEREKIKQEWMKKAQTSTWARMHNSMTGRGLLPVNRTAT